MAKSYNFSLEVIIFYPLSFSSTNELSSSNESLSPVLICPAFNPDIEPPMKRSLMAESIEWENLFELVENDLNGSALLVDLVIVPTI